MELSKQDVVSHVVAFGLGVLLGYQVRQKCLKLYFWKKENRIANFSNLVNRKHFCLIWNCVYRLKAGMEMEKIGTHAVAFAIGIAVGYYYKKWKDENWHRRWVRQILVQRRSRLAQELLKILNAAEGEAVISFCFSDSILSIFYSAPFLSHVVYLFIQIQRSA